MPRQIEISTRTIITVVASALGLYLLYYIRDIIQLLFISFIVMSALSPLVESLERYRIPKIMAIIIIYSVIASLIGIYVRIVLPPLITETTKLITHLPEYTQQLSPYININYETFTSQLAPLTQNVYNLTIGVFSNLFTFITIAVFAFYFLLQRTSLRLMLNTFIGNEVSDQIVAIVRKIEVRLGAWVRGQVILAIIIGATSYIGLSILGVSYALPLALIAGLLEVVPIIGPIISAVPAVLVGLTISPGLALVVVALYIIIQQLENNLIVPAVMQRAVGVPPLASLLALLIGGRLGGVIGVILSVPILLVLQIIIDEVLKRQKN